MSHGDEPTAMEVVTANEDLLTEILLFLPPRSLLRFKSVSKFWLSIISSTRFRLLKNRRFRKDIISGLFLRRHPVSRHPVAGQVTLDFLPLNEGGNDAPFEMLDFVDGERDLFLLQSCNGLLLCRNYVDESSSSAPQFKYYVVNPTTKEYTMALTGDASLRLVYIAFDPRKSIHFKLICAHRLSMYSDFELRVYSSETGLMTQIGDPLNRSSVDMSGVYWNDALVWLKKDKDAFYFNVGEERFGRLPMPDTRFCVDLQPVFASFPEAANYTSYAFQIMDVVVEKDDDEELVLIIPGPGKAIRFHLKDKSFTEMYDYVTWNRLNWSLEFERGTFQFIQSLHPL